LAAAARVVVATQALRRGGCEVGCWRLKRCRFGVLPISRSLEEYEVSVLVVKERTGGGMEREEEATVTAGGVGGEVMVVVVVVVVVVMMMMKTMVVEVVVVVMAMTAMTTTIIALVLINTPTNPPPISFNSSSAMPLSPNSRDATILARLADNEV
jgi:hypothetical protein